MVNEEIIYSPQINELLQSVCSIVAPPKEVDEYNIFSVLEISDKEVIMCRMLADLLNPRGQHGQGAIFLYVFLEYIVGIKEKGKLEEYTKGVFVKKEYSTKCDDNPSGQTDLAVDSKKDDGRIDIVIYNRKYFLPIEVKIKHEERNNQCLDYYQFAFDIIQDREAKIIYLTKDGSKPAHYSKMGKNCICISWGKEILNWLRYCLEIFPHGGNIQVKSMIKNYMNAISSFTNERGEEMTEECRKIIMGDGNDDIDNIRACVEITKTFGLVQDEIIRELFRAFDQEIQSRYCWEKDDQEPNDWKNMGREFFGNLFVKYGSQNPCTTFKVKRSNSTEYFRLCIRIQSRVWCEVLDNNGKRVNRKWIYLPSGVHGEKLSCVQDENIPNFSSMNMYAIKLSQEGFRKRFVDESLKKVEEVWGDELLFKEKL